MGKRFGALGVVLAAVVLVVGLVSPAVGAAAGASKQRDIRVDSFVTELNVVDVAPTGAGPAVGATNCGQRSARHVCTVPERTEGVPADRSGCVC